MTVMAHAEGLVITCRMKEGPDEILVFEETIDLDKLREIVDQALTSHWNGINAVSEWCFHVEDVEPTKFLKYRAAVPFDDWLVEKAVEGFGLRPKIVRQ